MSLANERALAIFHMFEKHWRISCLPEDPHPVELALRKVVAGYLADPGSPSGPALLSAIDLVLDSYQQSYDAAELAATSEKSSLEAERAMMELVDPGAVAERDEELAVMALVGHGEEVTR